MWRAEWELPVSLYKVICMVRLVITYDIRKDKIRNKLFRLLERYGAWKQYSVFELEITPVHRIELFHSITDLIEDSDRVRIYELCERCQGKITEFGEVSPDKMHVVI